MTTYNKLKKIIPPDQALANEALSRSLQQVKSIFDTDLPALAEAVSQLESNKDLDLINSLSTPLPPAIGNYWGNTFATGTGPGNTITINDVIGIAAGATVTTALPEVSNIVVELSEIGALDPLTGNGGTPSSNINGAYTVMSYCLAGAYTSSSGVDPDPIIYTVTIPTTDYFAGGSFSDSTESGAVSDAFASLLIPVTNSLIANIANAYPEQAAQSNADTDAMANQLAINVTNSLAAGIDIGNVVNDIANANLVANSVSTALGLTSRLHEIGLDVTTGGAAQFFDSTANLSTVTGQAVIASMREGRNIAVLNAVGIQLDTQLPDVNPDPSIANNISQGQYTVSEARANISL
jgi:hypothetical protein